MELENNVSKVLIESWTTDEELYELTAYKRNNEIVTGIVRAVMTRELKKFEGEQEILVPMQIIMVALPNGSTAYCTPENFATREYKNYTNFVGFKRDFYIADIQLDTKLVFLDGKRAQTRKINEFWENIRELEKAGKLYTTVFNAVVSGASQRSGNVFVNIEGQDAMLPATEWSYNSREMIRVQEGSPVQVMVTKVNYEAQRLVVSRRLTLPNPTKLFENLAEDAVIVGRVVEVDPLHGIRVELENNVVVKASRRKTLEEPIVGETVSCRIVNPITYNDETGRIEGRVLIRSYPNGKQKRRNLGAFLFE